MRIHSILLRRHSSSVDLLTTTITTATSYQWTTTTLLLSLPIAARCMSSSSSTTTTTMATTSALQQPFYVLARENGKFSGDLPVWASHNQDPFGLGNDDNSVTTSIAANETCTIENSGSRNVMERRDIEGVPGAFQLLNVLSKDEAQRMVNQFEELGFTDDAAVSLPRSIRHNSNLNWIADNSTLDIIWNRCRDLFPSTTAICSSTTTSRTPLPKNNDHGGFGDEDFFLLEQQQHSRPLGLNGKFRVYRYEMGDFFKPHMDGSWPGSRVVDGQYVQDAFDGRLWSMYTWLLFLTDDFDGGETDFFVHHQPTKERQQQQEAELDTLSQQEEPTQRSSNGKVETIWVRTPVGGVLCFPHGEHPLHCLHSSAPITSSKGVKYIIRSDVLFEV